MATHRSTPARFISPGILIALGIVGIVSTAGLTGQGPSDPGADGYPRIILIGIIIVGILLLFDRGKQEEPRLSRGQILRVAGAVGLLIVYYFTLNPLGYISATVILVAGGLLLMGVRRWLPLVLVSAVFALANFYLFYVAFGVPLPLSQVEKVLL